MKIDLLEGFDQAIVRIYELVPDSCRLIKAAIDQLASAHVNEIRLTDVSGVERDGHIELVAIVGRRDQGILRKGGNVLHWVLTSPSWDNVAGLIEPFCENASNGYQWLEQAGDIRVLLSTDGSW
jgi:hypothetical protein